MKTTSSDREKVFTIVGNRKVISVKNVTDVLRVVGNNNRIEVAHNGGTVEVIGNRCRLNIDENDGGVVIIGNHGVISIANPARGCGGGGGGGAGVSSTGHGCKIVIGGSMQAHSGYVSNKTKRYDVNIKGLETLPT